MKKIILSIFALLFIQNTMNAGIHYYKDGGGWFGYKYVTTTYWTNGECSVDCTGGGFSRCKAALAILVSSDGPELSPQTLEAIDNTVTLSINANNTNGKFIFDQNLFVTYNYNVVSNRLTFSIYTINEAVTLGLI